MSRPITLEERIIYLKKLHTLFCTNYVHEVDQNLLSEIEDVGEWDYAKVTIRYKRKITYTKEEIVQQLQNIWPIFNQVWPKYRDDNHNNNNNNNNKYL